ncbi:hypothetical protein SAMD00023353_4700410 [Rosellinia necatrix]|uniref:Uncharacterized protein n=1 Tax=Rosellinia necatrix TaxID=77044 RepID=A0A1S8A9W2_ROSNE|nr:hypothetical protein SAMD00023353_4700410 [Rosellinia necatrix]
MCVLYTRSTALRNTCTNHHSKADSQRWGLCDPLSTELLGSALSSSSVWHELPRFKRFQSCLSRTYADSSHNDRDKN